MNDHLTDGQLRAALDGELDGRMLEHLASCAECQARQAEIRRHAARAAQRLAFLAPREQERAPAADAAWQRFHSRKLPQKETPMIKKLFASAAFRYAAVAVLLLALILSFPATRALANEVLNLFRVQQVTVVPVDFTGLQQLNGNDEIGKQFSDLVSGSITMKHKPGEPVTVGSADEASQKAGFTVRLPQNTKFSMLVVQDRAAFEATIDRAKAQALLNEAGRSDLQLPKDIDGSTISVNVPSSIIADYGTCPDPRKEETSFDPGSPGRRYPDCIILSEIPSPEVNAPANVDVAQIAQLGLEFTGMTSEEAAAFTQTVDWTSTLVVPIPKNAARYKQVQVDGVTGTLIQRPADDAPQFLLIWIKDGIVYSIGGLGTNSQQAIDMANSLK
ncbi:MAG: anti-sigma factor family protein [Anaerolineae bacterium]